MIQEVNHGVQTQYSKQICYWFLIVSWQNQGPGKRGHIVADTNVYSFARARNISCGHKKCFWFCSETFCVRNKCSQVTQPKKHHEQQSVRNNVSSFARALKDGSSIFVENDDVAIIMRVTRVHPSVSTAGDCFQISPAWCGRRTLMFYENEF